MVRKGKMMPAVKFGRPIGLYWGVGLLPAPRHRLRMDAPGDIEFRLRPSAVRDGYHFDLDDPIWVCVDNGSCPSRGSSHPDIVNIRPTADTVTVTNLHNVNPVDLRYQLNVLDRDGRPKPIDPIIENRA